VKKEHKYVEGSKARENFEKFTSAILQVPKAGSRKQAKANPRKKHGSDKG
jgi:hypothetical protein